MLGIGAVSFSSISSFLSGASPLAIAFYRNFIGGLILLPLVARGWREFGALSRREVLLLVIAGLFFSIHFASWITSLFYTSITASVVPVHSDPLIAALLAFVFLGEKPSRRTMLGFVVALAGVVLITAEGGLREPRRWAWATSLRSSGLSSSPCTFSSGAASAGT
ncbi:MAG: DMT family transporter [Conexivisphaerales archaeon]